MSFPDCPDCERLRKEYAAATHARFRAEADLTAATFSHNAAEVKRVKKMARTKLARWEKVAEALHHHEEMHARHRAAGSVA